MMVYMWISLSVETTSHLHEHEHRSAHQLHIKGFFLLRQIAIFTDGLKYLSGCRRRLLEILIAQQERMDLNRGINPPNPNPGAWAWDATRHTIKATGSASASDEFWTGNVGEDSVGEITGEPEAEMTHISSNLSMPGTCDPQNCQCEDKKCKKWESLGCESQTDGTLISNLSPPNHIRAF